MKDYLRLLKYARPFGWFPLIYIVLSLLQSAFGIFNFTLLIPLLDVLFNTQKLVAETQVAAMPAFEPSIDYLQRVFYYFFNGALASSGPKGALQFVCVIVVASVFFSNFFGYFRTRVTEVFKANVVLRIRREVFEKLTSLHVGYFSEHRKGDLLARCTTDIYELEGSITHTFTMIIQEPIMVFFYFVALIRISPELTLFALTAVPLMAGIMSFVVRKLRQDAYNVQGAQGTIISQLDETIDGRRIIKAFNAVDYIREKFNGENRRYAQLMIKYVFRRALAAPFSEFTGVLVVICILLYGGGLVLDGEGSLNGPQFVAYLIIFSQVMRPMKGISNAWSNVQRGLASGRRVFELLDTEVPVKDPEIPKQMPNFSSEIEFRNVGFAYDKEDVLKELSFKVPKGYMVALVGPSGAGKSTVADLIPRFYDVTAGSILIDGTDIREYSMDSLLAQIGVVTQESVLFNDTIFNNIAFGKPNAGMDEVVQAAKIANAHQFIMETENGYQTMVGDRGMKLSGGQRQRISIARAIFKNPPILILDEATSALDTESEKLVQEALENLMASRTSVVIAHRLSTIQHANLILVLDKGQIVERGTHSELLQMEGGLYQKLNAMQQTV